MTVIYFILAAALIAGVGLAIYEWRSKKTLLAHDFNKAPPEDAHTAAMREHVRGVSWNHISGHHY